MDGETGESMEEEEETDVGYEVSELMIASARTKRIFLRIFLCNNGI